MTRCWYLTPTLVQAKAVDLALPRKPSDWIPGTTSFWALRRWVGERRVGSSIAWRCEPMLRAKWSIYVYICKCDNIYIYIERDHQLLYIQTHYILIASLAIWFWLFCSPFFCSQPWDARGKGAVHPTKKREQTLADAATWPGKVECTQMANCVYIYIYSHI